MTLTRIGRYEIIRRLGKSMNEVYLAHDSAEDRKVALKLIPHGDDRARRLLVEAERRGAAIQKELGHLDPRVVKIYEYGDLDGYFFVAMEFVEGRTVADILSQDHVIDPCRAAIIALEICEQLAKFHAWESAVVHGDIKPSNINLGRSDTVRLLDFGIAKMLREDCNATAHQFGSPSYCSPERLTRNEVDPQSDLWSLGATLYEMLAGVPPYRADDTRRLEELIRSRRPPRALAPTCPAGLRAIVMKSLARNPRQRYRSAVDFQKDLQSFLERRTTVAEIEQRSRWNPNATLETARQALRRVTRTARRKDGRWIQVLGAFAYFATGMMLWIGGSLAWQLWQARASAAPPPIVRTLPPPFSAEATLAEQYLAAANGVLEAYRTSPNPWLYEYDWPKAEICLERAIQLGAHDDSATSKLALVRGYAMLERINGAQYSDTGAAALRLKARDQFRAAALKAPSDPAPRLALARVYTYSLPDPARAIAEFAAAEKLGAKLGRREVEQQGDVYRIRAQQLFARDRRQARRDAAVARAYYRRIPGFDQVDQHMKELSRIDAPVVHRVRARRYSRWR